MKKKILCLFAGLVGVGFLLAIVSTSSSEVTTRRVIIKKTPQAKVEPKFKAQVEEMRAYFSKLTDSPVVKPDLGERAGSELRPCRREYDANVSQGMDEVLRCQADWGPDSYICEYVWVKNQGRLSALGPCDSGFAPVTNVSERIYHCIGSVTESEYGCLDGFRFDGIIEGPIVTGYTCKMTDRLRPVCLVGRQVKEPYGVKGGSVVGVNAVTEHYCCDVSGAPVEEKKPDPERRMFDFK